MKIRICLLIAFVASLLSAAISSADAQSVGSTVVYAGVSNAVVLNHQSSNLVSTTVSPISLRQGTGVAVAAYLAGTNATTSQVGIGFTTSLDGTNYATAVTHWALLTLNGTTAVRSYTNFPAATLDNARKFKILTITNGHTASVFLTNVQVSFY